MYYSLLANKGGAGELIIRNACIKDIDKLITLRLDYLKNDKRDLSEKEEAVIRTQLKTYFINQIGNNFVGVFAELDGNVVSTAFLAISEKPANTSFITGKTGTLLNVFTYPEYRRKGFAEKVVRHIIDEAKKLDVSFIDLSATQAGKMLYEKLGFIEPKTKYTSMRLQII